MVKHVLLWRRRVMAVVVAVILGLTMVAVSATPAAAGFGDPPCISKQVPGPPRSATGMDGGLGWVGVRYEQPLSTILGLDCNPIEGYWVNIQDVTQGETGLWSYFAWDSGPFYESWDNTAQHGHSYIFAVFAKNKWGWSASTISAPVRVF